jgi:hypothetical protein
MFILLTKFISCLLSGQGYSLTSMSSNEPRMFYTVLVNYITMSHVKQFLIFRVRRHPHKDKGPSWPVGATSISLNRELGPARPRNGQILISWLPGN